MTQYSHKPSDQPEIAEIEFKETFRKSRVSSENLLPASIIVAAILISVSVFYNTNLILKKLDRGPAALGGSTAQNQQAPTQPREPQPTPQNDTGPVTVPSRGDAPVLGQAGAKVTIIEFSDFQCPFCARFFQDTFGQIKSKYIDTGQAKIIFRHYPLSFHANAQKAAEAAECANRQGKFWEYQDKLFTSGQADGTGLAVPDLKKYADELGLNKGTLGFSKNKFNQCLDNGEAAEVVKKDLGDANTAGVSGTPTFVINGAKLVGAKPFSDFEQAIEEALK